LLRKVLPLLRFTAPLPVGDKTLSDLTFVITGDVHRFDNRKALQRFIEEHGGRTTGTVTAKTSYLINNDITSSSGKNKKAAELGVPILSERDFLERFGLN
jgi:DNA ligase (NAD+)